MSSEAALKEVMIILRERYKKRGSNTIFKSRQLARETNFSSQEVGQALSKAIKRGYPIAWYTRVKTSGTHIWQTTFKEGNPKC